MSDKGKGAAQGHCRGQRKGHTLTRNGIKNGKGTLRHRYNGMAPTPPWPVLLTRSPPLPVSPGAQFRSRGAIRRSLSPPQLHRALAQRLCLGRGGIRTERSSPLPKRDCLAPRGVCPSPERQGLRGKAADLRWAASLQDGTGGSSGRSPQGSEQQRTLTPKLFLQRSQSRVSL